MPVSTNSLPTPTSASPNSSPNSTPGSSKIENLSPIDHPAILTARMFRDSGPAAVDSLMNMILDSNGGPATRIQLLAMTALFEDTPESVASATPPTGPKSPPNSNSAGSRLRPSNPNNSFKPPATFPTTGPNNSIIPTALSPASAGIAPSNIAAGPTGIFKAPPNRSAPSPVSTTMATRSPPPSTPIPSLSNSSTPRPSDSSRAATRPGPALPISMATFGNGWTKT